MGVIDLSIRERQILKALLDNDCHSRTGKTMTTRKIADKLGTSPRLVKASLKDLQTKQLVVAESKAGVRQMKSRKGTEFTAPAKINWRLKA